MSATGKKVIVAADGAPVGLPEDRPPLATVSEASRMSGLNRRYVRRLVDERRVATVKVGNRRYVALDDLDRLIRDGYTPARGGGVA